MAFLKSPVIFVLAIAMAVFSQASRSQTHVSTPPRPAAAEAAPQSSQLRTPPDNPRYRAFKTQNMWNLLILDSRTGRLWQAQYSVSTASQRTIWPIQLIALANESGTNGRFTLTMTDNMWNFILLDSDTGMALQCQFSVDSQDNRFCVPILPAAPTPIEK